MKSLSYGHQLVEDDDIEAVLGVLRGETLTQGAALEGFEGALEELLGVQHAVAVGNGTQALEILYRALGVGPGVRVLVPANTFLATATAAVRLGARVEFIDSEPETGNLCPLELARRLERGPAPDLVVAVHFAGLPCDMGRLLELKRAHGFSIVEDAAHALGARYRIDGRWWNPGQHPAVDGAILSFHPVKPITCGEGGAILTQHRDVAAHLGLLRSHGMATGELGRDASRYFAPMRELGCNARLSEMQAALGWSQLGKLERFRSRRARIAARYSRRLEGVEFLLGEDAEKRHAWHLFVIRVAPEERDRVRAELARRGIGTQVHYHPVPLQPWFIRHMGEVEVPRALAHALGAISLPLHPGLTDQDVDRVIEAVNEAVAPTAVAP